MFDLLGFLPRAIVQGVPLLFGSTGETLTEKSGNLNLGIPGIMYVGGISGVIGAFFYEQATVSAGTFRPLPGVLIPLVCSMAGSLLMGLLYCFLTVTLRANQNVSGLALTTFGVGIGNFFGGSLPRIANSSLPSVILTNTGTAFRSTLGGGSASPLSVLFLSYGFLVYLALAVSLAAAYVLRRTRVGLHLRAVGENPNTADAAGINVTRYKYLATCIGSMIAGLGGLYFIMDYSGGIWSNDAFGDRGWLAIALVIFTVWKPDVGVLASFLFGGLYILSVRSSSSMTMATKELYKMIPYVVTIVVLIFTSLRNKREDQPPASLGLAYFREER
ncbi:MAG: ABC transporter permease [Clostridia bacterium]